MVEVRFSGYGGQGIVRCGLIIGKALALYDNKCATMTQSFGPEARGSACSAQLVVSEEEILYPYITEPDILTAMSQDAYAKYISDVRAGGTLLVDDDLVERNPKLEGDIHVFSIPATRFAEELGNRIVANLVMIGFVTAVTGLVSPEAVKKALPGLVPNRFLDLNLKAFERGLAYGQEMMTAAQSAEPKQDASNTVYTSST